MTLQHPTPGERDVSAVWAATGHLVSPAYPPELEAVRDARRFVSSSLEAIGLQACASDAGLMVSELAANAVLHARSSFVIHLRPTLEFGVRVEVQDRSHLPPVPATPSASATSGRGLDLVASMASRWGSHPLPSGRERAEDAAVTEGARPDGAGPDGAGPDGAGWVGKIVWFEIEASGVIAEPDANTEELMALWSDLEDLATLTPPAAPAAALETGLTTGARKIGIITSSLPALEPVFDVVVEDLPVTELLEAKEAMDDLLRELQLLLLSTPAAGTRVQRGPASSSATDDERRVAARLDSAARAFEQGRRQVREQVGIAAARGEVLVTLRLRLPASARQAAVRYREAAESAGELGRADHLLTLPDVQPSHPLVRRRYLDEVIRQLPDAG